LSGLSCTNDPRLDGESGAVRDRPARFVRSSVRTSMETEIGFDQSDAVLTRRSLEQPTTERLAAATATPDQDCRPRPRASYPQPPGP